MTTSEEWRAAIDAAHQWELERIARDFPNDTAENMLPLLIDALDHALDCWNDYGGCDDEDDRFLIRHYRFLVRRTRIVRDRYA